MLPGPDILPFVIRSPRFIRAEIYDSAIPEQWTTLVSWDTEEHRVSAILTEEAIGFYVRFSNRPVGVKRFQTVHDGGGRCRSRGRASLRNRLIGPSIMGSEDGAEQSNGRPCR